jgi:predicted enzyme related to lactoylglutathione lyase
LYRVRDERRDTPVPPLPNVHLFATLHVGDFGVARAWYERLFGEPTFFAHAAEAVWTLAEGRSVAVNQDRARAGHGSVTIFADDLDAQVAEIAARGLQASEIETYSNGVRKVIFRDPDGNEVGFGGARAARGG